MKQETRTWRHQTRQSVSVRWEQVALPKGLLVWCPALAAHNPGKLAVVAAGVDAAHVGAFLAFVKNAPARPVAALTFA